MIWDLLWPIAGVILFALLGWGLVHALKDRQSSDRSSGGESDIGVDGDHGNHGGESAD